MFIQHEFAICIQQVKYPQIQIDIMCRHWIQN